MYIFRKRPNVSSTWDFEHERDSFKLPIFKYEMLKETPDILEHDYESFKNRRLIGDVKLPTLNMTEV